MENKTEFMNITEYFKDVEQTIEHNGYFCSIGDAIGIVIIGMFCGFKNINTYISLITSKNNNKVSR